MTENDEIFRELEQKNEFMAYNHIHACDADMSGATVKVDLTDKSLNHMGYIHGGLIFSLLDIASGLAARADGRRYVTQSTHVNFLSNVGEGTVYGKSSVIKRGRRIVVVHAQVVTEDNTVLADASVDMYCTSE